MMTEQDNQKAVSESIPNKAFDSEYMTEWVREVKFLAGKGINCTYIRKTPKYNIKQYKYTKTPELFVALAEFYLQARAEKCYNKLNKTFMEATQIPQDVAQALRLETSKGVNNANAD